MTLKQIMLGKKVEQRKDSLAELLKREDEFKERSEGLEEAINQAENDEEIRAVEEEITALENEKTEHEEEKKKLEEEIGELEKEIEELTRKKPNEGGKREMPKTNELRSAINEFIRTKGAVQERDIEGFKVVDGGILVPEEMLSPEKEVEDVVNLLPYVKEVGVKRGSGKYPVISKSGSKMNTVAELEANPELAKPTVSEVNYDIDTYRGYIPVSQEVIDDADYDIVGLIDDEIRDQELNTRNHAISTVLKTATAKAVNGLDELITLLNTGFKKAYQVKLYVSSSFYNELDLLKDKNGRYLLQDDITLASGKRFKSKEVVVLDDDMIGTADGDLKAFIGDAKAFCKFFNRKQVSVKWVDNNIYGQMLAGFVRFDVKKADADAGYYVTYTPDPVEEEVPEV